MLQWLSIDRSSLPRKQHARDRDSSSLFSKTSLSSSPTTTAPTSASRREKPPPSVPPRDDKPPPSAPHIVVPSKIRRARHNTSNLLDRSKHERRSGHKRSETLPAMFGKQPFDEEHSARNFTVANVGAGGTLYLKPSRTPVAILNRAPATPPATSGASSERSNRPLLRNSDISGTWTLRPDRPRSVATMAGSPAPPMSLSNSHNRRTRSHSESTVSDRRRGTLYDANEFSQSPIDNDRPPIPRRRSSADVARGLGDVQIPHYRLGTPRFSERGTAYLHYSMHTNSTDGVPSSVLSQAEYEKLFPVPPGRDIRSFYSHVSGAPFLHPASAYSRSTTSRPPIPSTRPSTIAITGPALFEKLESNLDDPGVVHYHPVTGRIVAATPARLIAQITSPQFLDYELLADFFLTFRSFMPCRDVLEYLFARMRWAFQSGNDAGRIARVRTFVALRHWILNYFADDFMSDLALRQNLCDLANELARTLRVRPDRGGSDMNIIGELKKCWRRTSAMYWPVPDAQESSPDADIVPGGDMEESPVPVESALSLPLTIRPTTRSHSIFEMTQIQLPDRPGRFNGAPLHLNGPSQRSTATSRTASIPASPISEQSLEVLSCSVPFLRNIRPTARPREKQTAPPRALQTQGRAGKPTARPKHGHKRSGSFSDALRDHRTPLSSPKAENIELKDLPSFSITGGLVRGILLQPMPAKVDNNVPVTPGPPGTELTEARLAANDGALAQIQPHQHHGVKKLVGEVRRALGSRKGSSQSPSRSLGSASSGSESRGKPLRVPRKPQPDWQQLPGPSRLDILGSRIESAYQDAFEQTRKDRPQTQQLEQEDVANGEPAIPDNEQPPGTIHGQKALPGVPDPEDSVATATPNDHSIQYSAHDSTSVMDFGRLNSHVTTGSRSIVIVDATGAPRIPTMSGAMHSMSSMSSDMMPIPLFREKSETPPVPSIPRDYGSISRSGKPSIHSAYTEAWRTSEERMDDFLAAPGTWGIHDYSRDGSHTASQLSHARRSSSLVRSPIGETTACRHQLRRRPGGDLKAADHVQDLERNVRPRANRSFSEGTSATAPFSAVQSTILSIPSTTLLPHSEPKKKKSVSLILMQTSQPILRASFVGEAERLRGLPDTENDGGIEDALLKLEGKIPSPSRSEFSTGDERNGDPRPQSPYSPLGPPPRLERMPNGEGKLAHLRAPQDQLRVNNASPMTETQGASIYHPSMSELDSMSSMTAYALPQITSMPMEPSSLSTSPTSVVPVTARLSRLPSDVPDPTYLANGASPAYSLTHEQKPDDTPDDARYPSYKPGAWSGEAPDSFIIDDNQSLSDISTDIASHHEDGIRSFYFDDTGNEGALPVMGNQPTPPNAMDNLLSQSPKMRRPLQRPRDPDRPLKEAISAPRLLAQTPNQPFPRRPYRGRKPERLAVNTETFPTHLPFVLAFESEVIAEQLTIIEKDALDEVDWKDLIGLNWQQTPPDVRNWVDYLNRENDRENANGIDIVIARFNLVVKWCVSEIILTEAVSERARTVTKFIHIAAHCHRLRNFSSMYQLVLALLSTDLARLHHTWSLVAPRERQMLEHLEQLCRPSRNFNSLREQMETSISGNGIIPFIGLYTHDLMFNALKSPRIAGPGPEPLVNFERFQTAASIVKNLLRLIEASSRYAFHPDPEALSRCLWIAALDDDEIAARSRSVEAL